MKNRITLFEGDPSAPPESDTFIIPQGSQLTITAIGLDPGDTITFQMVYVPSLDPDRCSCPPGTVTLPSVAGFAELRCCGSAVTLGPDNPVVILDNPQRTLLRAVLNAVDPSSVFAWAVETDTSDINDRLRGCGCSGQPGGE